MTPEPPPRSGNVGLRGRLLAQALCLLATTWRVTGVDAIHAELGKWKGTPLLVALWHGKYFPLLVLLRGTHAHLFIGEGRRGTRLDGVCRRLGFSPVLLPHGDRGRAITRMRTALTSAVPCATAFDGPLGPTRQVKPALVELASATGATIVPLSVSARPRTVLRWRWDRREIPWLFARVQVRVGDPMQLPAGLAEDGVAEWCERVKRALDTLGDERSE